MGTFTISLPTTDQEVVELVAKKEMRSRTKQIQKIVHEWTLKNEPKVSAGKPE
jgi:hypothetical protein